MESTDLIESHDRFADRHVGPDTQEIEEMLSALGRDSLDDLATEVIPKSIRLSGELDLPPAETEHEALVRLRRIASGNDVRRSFIGAGYYNCFTPPVILRNVLENPGWYTQYTPYQSEISQGRLEALLNYQTLVSDLTALPVSNSSLLDEATAAAEAMGICDARARGKRKAFFAAADCHPQTLGVVRTRAEPLGIELRVGDPESLTGDETDLCGVLLQYPATDGTIRDIRGVIEKAHGAGALAVVATDLLALTILTPPGELGADIAVGSSQRFGVPLGAGGPHAAFLSATDELERVLPGRIVGISKDAQGRPALRLARQTREQHIRREKATSNICTAQVLLAIMASMFAVYHGAEGVLAIARRVARRTGLLAAGLRKLGLDIGSEPYFDTVRVRLDRAAAESVSTAAAENGFNLRQFEDGSLGISLDETVTEAEVAALLGCFSEAAPDPDDLEPEAPMIPEGLRRQTPFLVHEVFKKHRSEHEMLRYLHKLQERDISLTHSMIPLGSCTMKLNASAEMIPITWSEFGDLHPYAPEDQQRGYARLYSDLEAWLAEMTGFSATSLQPNAGSQGEYSGLMVIRAYHRANGQHERDVCLIPTSAHGTNPASAVMAGLRVIPVASDEMGNIDMADLKEKASTHADQLAALMVTYPSTYGIFDEGIQEVCSIVHEHGGQVYLDGANMNAQVGLCRPGDYGADVCHLNLHKTFCIPHGGGGPGMGPICVAEHLAPYLPGHPWSDSPETAIGAIAAAPFGSPGILPISWMYIAMMGADGLEHASKVAILNANYMAWRLADHYPILFRGRGGLVAHEFIIDLRDFKDSAGVVVDDVAKRLIDFGFHAPTMAWPVAGTMMVEPTESESKDELDRFCDAMIAIRSEIRGIEEGSADREDNPLKNAPHTAAVVTADEWRHGYSRAQAAFPLVWIRERKFWPPVGRVDNAYGDRHLVCTCEPVEAWVDKEVEETEKTAAGQG